VRLGETKASVKEEEISPMTAIGKWFPSVV